MRIYLIGLTGSGKTTLGRQLALKLDVPFIDLDEYVTGKEKRSVADIFNTDGENYFRILETEGLKEISKMKDVVISTGGGAACFHDNMTLMNISGLTIFLDVPIPEIAQRLWNQPHREQRPMIANKTLEELKLFLQILLDKRMEFYSEAKLIFQGGDISVKKILEDLNELD
jgi:shikimate kinase